jgi:SAM-dependent methyltransferase
MSNLNFLDTAELITSVIDELAMRRSSTNRYTFLNKREGKPDNYGTTGAINCFAILGISLGDQDERIRWARAVRSFQGKDGKFPGDCAEHSLAMAIQALNLLGEQLPHNLYPLAPLEVCELEKWLCNIDWTSTHKKLWGGSMPIVASNLGSEDWQDMLWKAYDTFMEDLINKMNEFSNEEPWKYISKAYHVLSLYDAAGRDYPIPNVLAKTLIDIEWPKNRTKSHSTICTDGDWAYMLMQTCKQATDFYGIAVSQIKNVSNQRILEWNNNIISLKEISTHHIYCHLWVTAFFQSVHKQGYHGPVMWDTLNHHSLFRININNAHSALKTSPLPFMIKIASMARLRRLLKLIVLQRRKKEPLAMPHQDQNQFIFIKDNATGINTRRYQNYEDYVNHQSKKLSTVIELVKQYDSEYEKIVLERYGNLKSWAGSSVLCLAARLGGEVRAFKTLGALSIGLDLEPGPKNNFVLPGDFHNIQFADNTFDCAFTNAIDHVLDIETFLKEVSRILKADGCFIMETAIINPGEYEVLDTSDLEPLLKITSKHFSMIKSFPISNQTSYANWSGKTLIFQKLEGL